MPVVRVFIYLVLAFVLLAVYVRIFESKTIFLPTRKGEGTPADAGLDYTELYFRTEDGVTLNGWLVKASPSAATLIFCHGNAGNISHRLDKIALFHRLGLNVFIFDYRGYGKSQGRPSEEGLYRDVRAAYDTLMSRDDVLKNKVMVYGNSLGGVAAVDVGVHRNVAAVILDSTFSSARDMARVILPVAPAFLIRTRMDSLANIRRLTVPKLVIHSTEDEIVPFALGRKLYDAAPDPKEFLSLQGDHNGGYALSADVFTAGIRRFLEKYDLL